QRVYRSHDIGEHSCAERAFIFHPNDPMISPRLARYTAAKPFNASRISVAIPRPGEVRTTLVAPIFPLPLCRISAPRNRRTNTYPNWTDPMRYLARLIAMMLGMRVLKQRVFHFKENLSSFAYFDPAGESLLSYKKKSWAVMVPK